jgi:hypothetical protein
MKVLLYGHIILFITSCGQFNKNETSENEKISEKSISSSELGVSSKMISSSSTNETSSSSSVGLLSYDTIFKTYNPDSLIGEIEKITNGNCFGLKVEGDGIPLYVNEFGGEFYKDSLGRFFRIVSNGLSPNQLFSENMKGYIIDTLIKGIGTNGKFYNATSFPRISNSCDTSSLLKSIPIKGYELVRNIYVIDKKMKMYFDSTNFKIDDSIGPGNVMSIEYSDSLVRQILSQKKDGYTFQDVQGDSLLSGTSSYNEYPFRVDSNAFIKTDQPVSSISGKKVYRYNKCLMEINLLTKTAYIDVGYNYCAKREEVILMEGFGLIYYLRYTYERNFGSLVSTEYITSDSIIYEAMCKNADLINCNNK